LQEKYQKDAKKKAKHEKDELA